MVILMGSNAFGTRLQSLWIMFFFFFFFFFFFIARKEFPCGVKPNAGQNHL